MLQVCLFACCIFSHICNRCFISWMLYLLCNGFQKCFHGFLQVFQTHVSSVLSALRHSRSDVVAGIHLLQASATAVGAQTSGRGSGGRRERSPRGVRRHGPMWAHETEYRSGRLDMRVRPNIWALALSQFKTKWGEVNRESERPDWPIRRFHAFVERFRFSLRPHATKFQFQFRFRYRFQFQFQIELDPSSDSAPVRIPHGLLNPRSLHGVHALANLCFASAHGFPTNPLLFQPQLPASPHLPSPIGELRLC
jgi:hypothetical protein